MLPRDTSVQAEYKDGYILDETESDDTSQFQHLIPKDADGANLEGNNIFSDILNKRPEADHGPLVRFSVFFKDQRYDIDWTSLPDNARPIRFRNMSGDYDPDTGDMVNIRVNWLRFGYQFKDEAGKNQQEVRELS